MSKEKQIEEIIKVLNSESIRWGCGDTTDKDIAEALYDANYRKQEWISVDERLPEKDVRVLVFIRSNRSYTRFDTDRLDDRGFVRWFNDVTHWMPLPEPPEMKGGGE